MNIDLYRQHDVKVLENIVDYLKAHGYLKITTKALIELFDNPEVAQQSVQADGNKIALDGTFPCPECNFSEKHLASCSRR